MGVAEVQRNHPERAIAMLRGAGVAVRAQRQYPCRGWASGHQCTELLALPGGRANSTDARTLDRVTTMLGVDTLAALQDLVDSYAHPQAQPGSRHQGAATASPSTGAQPMGMQGQSGDQMQVDQDADRGYAGD
eukprot:3833330-Prorocentrum_lima.AAC.1